MALTLFEALSERDKSVAVKKLIEQGSPRQDFFLMVSLSVAMATFGLLLNSVAVLIGSMLIAPLLYPALSLALGVVINDNRLMGRSLWTMTKSAIMGISLATVITSLFSDQQTGMFLEEWVRTRTSLISAAVAVTAGTAASFALVKPKLSETLPGVAISAALIPPLAVIGIDIAQLDWTGTSNAALLFLVNVVGITLASVVIFSLMGLYQKRKVVKAVVAKDEREIKEEENGTK